MFERFTDSARRVVVLAQEEARGLRHNYIGTEHILLGLIRVEDGVASRILGSLGVELSPARQLVSELIGLGESTPPGHVPFTPRAKKVLELSLREALQLGDKHIGTEHILLGLINEGEGIGAQMLARLGVSLSSARAATVGTLREMEVSRETHPERSGIPVAQGPRGGVVVLGAPEEQDVFVSSIETEDFEPDPEVGGETHMFRDSGGLQAGLWRVPAGATWEPFTFTLEQNETILILEGRVRIQVTGGATLDLAAGDMVSLNAGMETTWDVHPPFKEFWVLS
jgi:ATPases with chaperone activity, ATP-binding subunit